MKTTKEIICFFDGACAPINPGGYMGWGAIIQENNFCKHFFDGFKKTPENSNNIAEYLGILTILNNLEGEKGKEIKIFGDSMLVIQQMNEQWKIKSGYYLNYAIYGLKMIRELRKDNTVKCYWIPREKNSDADELSNEGIKKVAGKFIEFKKYKKNKQYKNKHH